MKKKSTPPIDMTNHGPVRDIAEGGYLDCSRNLCSVLSTLFDRRIRPKNRRKIEVLVSTIYYEGERPQRVELYKVYTFGYLCRVYANEEGRPFDPKDAKDKTDFDRAVWEQEARRRSAWGQFVQTMHLQKLHDQEKEVESLPRDKQEARRKEFQKKNGSTVMYVG